MSVSQVIISFDNLSLMESRIESNDQKCKVKLLAKKIKQTFGNQINQIVDPDNEYTPVKLAAKRGNLILVEALLAAGADENKGNPDCTLESLYQKFIARQAEKDWDLEMGDIDEEFLKTDEDSPKTKEQKMVISENDTTCIVCWVEERKYAPVPCYHRQYCKACIEKIFKDLGRCSTCRREMTNIVEIFT